MEIVGNEFRGKLLHILSGAIIMFFCSGCATIRHPVPPEMIGMVRVNDMSDIRIMRGMVDPELRKSAIRSLEEEDKDDYPVDSEGRRVYPMLSISGGAANGAYGAGLLKGWSEEGTRPKFKAVTGVSTGAIIAPLVFLGKEYDDMIEELYTTMSTKNVMKMKGVFDILFGNSFASSRPLKKLLEKYITPDILEKIAYEHKHGRRLYAGTTYLDAQRFVVWDMGAIASRGDAKLFSSVILASASIPMVFPPVFIDVEKGGIEYDEMHVDGGTITQVFTLYGILEGSEDYAKEIGVDISKIKGKYYIIRNGYVNPGYKVVKDDLASITGQMFDTMINAQGVGDTYRIYTHMKERGNDYNLAFIPKEFRPEKKEEFDPRQMRKLFDRGYQDAVNGYKWLKMPPGLRDSVEERPNSNSI